MTRYTAITPDDLREMLAAIGLESIEQIFAQQIPAQARFAGRLDLPPGSSELEVYEQLRGLAERNTSCEQQISFLGAGFYDNYVPAFIDMLCERSEWLTPYTPYQPEVSQGTLQAMFEYQTAISELTGLPIANASVYDGASAAAAAAYMAKLHTGSSRIVASGALHPQTLQTLATYVHGFGGELAIAPLADGSGRTDIAVWREMIDDATAAAIYQQPNFYGVVEDAPALVAAGRGGVEAGRQAPLIVASVDPLSLGILASPGECGADVALGEGQALGGRLDFGGPSFGFFAARAELLRRMPGRIAGQAHDAAGRRGYVLALQTREQHIRREKATSNICTSQALNAFAGLLHLVWLGRRGLIDVGELLLARTDYARRRLLAIPGVEALRPGPVFREIALRIDGDLAAVRAACLRQGVNPGLDIEALSGRREDCNGLLVALSERRTRADIDRLCELLAGAIADPDGAGVQQRPARRRRQDPAAPGALPAPEGHGGAESPQGAREPAWGSAMELPGGGAGSAAPAGGAEKPYAAEPLRSADDAEALRA